MSFVLTYEEKNRLRRKQFKSYYECITKKEELRKQGIQVSLKENSVKLVKCPPSLSLGKNGKQKVSAFLEMCNNIGDYKNAKRYRNE